MGKNIAAGVAGVIVAFFVVWLVEKIGHSVYPLPPDLNFADKEAMRAYIDTVPLGALLFVAGAWFLGALGGTVTACTVGDAKPVTYAIVVGGLMLLATAANLIMIPHPAWFSITGVVGILIATWLGMTIGTGSQSKAE